MRSVALRSRTMPRDQTIGIRFSPEELELLAKLEAQEERTRSDIVRRAVRAYAEAVLKAPKKKR